MLGRGLSWWLTTLVVMGCAVAEEPVRVAVAASARPALEELVDEFVSRGGAPVELVTGSTGRLYAQIVHGAPYDLFFAADLERPERLVAEGLARGLVVYGRGRLVLWAPSLAARRGEELAVVMTAPEVRRVAVANPRVAPYGTAALAALEQLGYSHPDRLVYGEDVGQVFHLVATGAVDAGFVAHSQLVDSSLPGSEVYWPVPSALHGGLPQGAVRIERRGNTAAGDLLEFLDSRAGRDILERRGFDSPEGD